MTPRLAEIIARMVAAKLAVDARPIRAAKAAASGAGDAPAAAGGQVRLMPAGKVRLMPAPSRRRNRRCSARRIEVSSECSDAPGRPTGRDRRRH